jgi:hypothetical protein
MPPPTAPDPQALDCVRAIQRAINDHDLEAMAACFDPLYQSQFPAHPERAFTGHAAMRQNWSKIFDLVPDIHAILLASVVSDETAWAEWEWIGTRRDGQPYHMRGVTIQEVRQGRVQRVRLYMEPVMAAIPSAHLAPHGLAGRDGA